jgi:hypothetical protein
MKAAGIKLILCDVEESIMKQLEVTEAYELIGEESIFASQSIVDASLAEAFIVADKWIATWSQDVEATESEDVQESE